MEQNDILNKFRGTNAGMSVPEGFFDDFNRRMAQSLPRQPWEQDADGNAPTIMPRTRWQKVRPYVYLAAMFMGIWCMMKMFTLMKQPSHADINNNTVLMSAINNDAFYYDYCIPDVSESDIYDDLYNQGVDADDIFEGL